MPQTVSPYRRRFIVRYLLGDDLAGGRRTDATYWRRDVTSVTESRWACLPGWKRQLVRLAALPTVPTATAYTAVSVASDPHLWANSAGAVGTILATRATIGTGQAIRYRRFRNLYVKPLTRAVTTGPKSVPGARVHVSPDMAGLAARLVKPMSPAEIAARKWYGAHIQPAIYWAPERMMRAYWGAHTAAGPLRKRLDYFRKPSDTFPSRVEIVVPGGFVSKEQRDLIRQAVIAKIGLSDLVESWDQVGPVAVGTWTVRERPPGECTLADIAAMIPKLAEWEFIIGTTTGGRPVIISLDDDSPHIACSAGSGAGKSVLAKAIAVQVLARGGRVTIIDRKGSHRWARGLAGVTYCTKPAEIQDALIRLSDQADDRNQAVMDHEEGWDPGTREFVIFEEMNATIPWLRMWWDNVRAKTDPKQCPAIIAFRNIMFMGRSGKTNLFGVAQMLTAQTTGGPEARENFGVRLLARYTANNWKMLCPDTPMPRRSKHRGRWQCVTAGEATEVQVVFLTDAEARELASVPMTPGTQTASGQRESVGTPVDGYTTPELLTLRQAAERYCPGVSVDSLKQRRKRARARGGGPKFARLEGRAELYDADEFLRWLTAESLTQEATKTDV